MDTSLSNFYENIVIIFKGEQKPTTTGQEIFFEKISKITPKIKKGLRAEYLFEVIFKEIASHAPENFSYNLFKQLVIDCTLAEMRSKSISQEQLNEAGQKKSCDPNAIPSYIIKEARTRDWHDRMMLGEDY